MEHNEHVSVVADWKLEEIYGNIYGVCEINFGPPYDSLDIVQRFTLHNPTHNRCALFSLCRAIDLVLDSNFSESVNCIIFSTKSKWVHDAIDGSIKTKTKCGLLQHARSGLDKLKKRYTVDLIYLVREIDDSNYVKLDSLYEENGEEDGDRVFDAKYGEKMMTRLIRSGAKPLRKHKK